LIHAREADMTTKNELFTMIQVAFSLKIPSCKMH